jgi:GTP-binding protein
MFCPTLSFINVHNARNSFCAVGTKAGKEQYQYLSPFVVSFATLHPHLVNLDGDEEEEESEESYFGLDSDEMVNYDEYDEGGIMSSSSVPTLENKKKKMKKWQRKRLPLIAVVGRPNVGKSALVNRIAGTQSGGSIVSDEVGITRDRTYRNAEFIGEHFQIVDTGGIVFDDHDDSNNKSLLFISEIRQQAMVAIEEAAGVILVVDGQVGMTSLDQQIADFLRKEIYRKIPVVVAVNKCESEKNGVFQAAEFWGLGLDNPFPVSAIHGVGTAELLEQLFQDIASKQTAASQNFGTKAQEFVQARKAADEYDEATKFLRRQGIISTKEDENTALARYESARAALLEDEEEEEEINVAIVGRPNVGKSSLLNALFGAKRAIVSDIAGTTRDAIDAVIHRDDLNTTYRFIDTAGIRKKSKVDFGPEFFMVNRALRAIRRSDVVLLVMDATEGVAEQDRILAQKVADDGRACIIVVNKWDAVVDKDSNTYDKSVKYFREEMPQVRWAPILFVSAETNQRVGKIYPAVNQAVQAHRKRIPTALLNEVLRDAIRWQPPPARRNGSQAKLYYCNQVSTRPPTIVMFVNDPKLVTDAYKRYLDRKFRESIPGFESTPVRWIFRGRRVRDITRGRTMNGTPGDGGTGQSFPFPHAQ